MRTILILICALTLFPASAEAWNKRFTVHPGETEKWTTPQWFTWTDNSIIRPRINGRWIDGSAYRVEAKRCHLGFARPGVLIDTAIDCERRDNLTFRVTNARKRNIRVRIKYWVPIPEPGGEKG